MTDAKHLPKQQKPLIYTNLFQAQKKTSDKIFIASGLDIHRREKRVNNEKL